MKHVHRPEEPPLVVSTDLSVFVRRRMEEAENGPLVPRLTMMIDRRTRTVVGTSVSFHPPAPRRRPRTGHRRPRA